MKAVFILIIFFLPLITNAQIQIVHKENINLRDGERQEWSTFPVHVYDSMLLIHFSTENTCGEQTLSLIQSDVNHIWRVKINGKGLGNLTEDEKSMTTYFPIPPGTLQEKDNVLIISPGTTQSNMTDDITVGNIILLHSSVNDVLSAANLKISTGIPSKLTILNDKNVLQPVRTSPGDTLAVRTGVIYSGTGNFSFSLPAGRYKVYASRGFEYGVDSLSVMLIENQTINKKLSISHEVNLKKWKSCDTHLHTFEFSGHGDASMKERILTIAGEGLDYGVITEHNKTVNITDLVKRMKMNKWFTPVTGDELTTNIGHFNIFPITNEDVLSPDVANWNQLAQNLRKLSDKKVVILNHARDIHNNFRPFDSLTGIKKETFPANAMEIMNSGSQQTDPRQLYLDWMMLLNKGIVLTPVGSSDSHDVSRFIAGQARTYVRSDGDFITNLIKGQVSVSFGLFTELDVVMNSSGKKIIAIKVYAPSWIKAQKIYLFANGKEIFTSKITRKKPGGLIGEFHVPVAGLVKGTLLVAAAEGGDPLVPWWPIARPYQHTSPEVNPIVLAITGAVRL
ncbi:MAG TPA: CehA/McbA family metallohydrolase [Flavitalea sp.]|nr:CehA/McbA family metallohydrolase [Flavitalea sp.]